MDSGVVVVPVVPVVLLADSGVVVDTVVPVPDKFVNMSSTLTLLWWAKL